MPGLQRTSQNESLKKMDLLTDGELQDIDVTDKVMARVHKLGLRKRGMDARTRMRPRIAVTGLTALLVLGVSVTGYATSQYVEFLNQKGEVVLKTAAAKEPTDFVTKYTNRLGVYTEQVKDQLQPGEYAAYYVKDDLINSADKLNPIKFEYKWVEHRNFSSFQDEMTRTQAPVLTALTHLPEGYQFDYGYVYPADMFTNHLEDPSYLKLADDLIRQSESSLEEERLFIQKLNWDKADFSLARYVKGKNYVNVTATRLLPDSKLTIFQGHQAKSEKLNIQGMEAYYIQSDQSSDQQTDSGTHHRIGWRDEHNHLLYEIYDNADSSLRKEDLVRMAEDLLTSR
ncbi:hypothetical protein [Paenibacillus pabuli]|uniref:hypothetical protein n=1 Tax=Paenibacillus pabuli TaxID=1472 RepID=UPI0007866ED8|nr:hypothetical protein [Paenibacillus pabuli]MEC0128255.1 DUF4367 domain-containing protein [Paenibacillus pabuli]